MYEVLLTRIFSVTMWYEHVFAAISIAMLGMTAGANLVLILPALLHPGPHHPPSALAALAFAARQPGAFDGAATPVRIAIAAGLLVPAGVLMDTAFPLGMKLAAARAPALTPWLWGVNGATSVVASVLAVVIALNAGIGAAFWTGWAAYAAALAALVAAQRARARARG